jgi:hypothetical protein
MTGMSSGLNSTLSPGVWKAAAAAHREKVRPWVEERTGRTGAKHPVYDFLFEYYFYRPALLARWSPGFGVVLEGAEPADVGWTGFEPVADGLVLKRESFPAHRRPYLEWAVRFLETTASRDPAYGCFGLHEWAMLYRTPAARHADIPLRLPPAETTAVVESLPVRCSHFDAFRFFTPAAVPLNRLPLSRESTTDHDQPACVHVTMDLYKFAFTISPYSPGELVADAFALARQAREIDMRASPYDLAALGFEPIRIETRAGREEYVEHQRRLLTFAHPIRTRLLRVYQDLRTG